METGDEIKSCSRSLRTTVTECCDMFCKESFVFTCLAYKNVQHFWNGPVQNLSWPNEQTLCYSSSHEYLHVDVDKTKNRHEQNFNGEANNKQLDSEDTQ